MVWQSVLSAVEKSQVGKGAIGTLGVGVEFAILNSVTRWHVSRDRKERAMWVSLGRDSTQREHFVQKPQSRCVLGVCEECIVGAEWWEAREGVGSQVIWAIWRGFKNEMGKPGGFQAER